MSFTYLKRMSADNQLQVLLLVPRTIRKNVFICFTQLDIMQSQRPLPKLWRNYDILWIVLLWAFRPPSKDLTRKQIYLSHWWTFYSLGGCLSYWRSNIKHNCRKLVRGFFLHVGIPLEIHTEQGRSFDSKLIKDVCKLLHIKGTRSIALVWSLRCS